MNYSRLLNQLIICLSLMGCANQLPPTGGEIDTIPPEIIEVYPLSSTVNYDKSYFEISFSEYVDKRSVQEAIFISPAMEGDVDYDWSGKSLQVYFENPLKPNTTFIISIGTDVVDINNGNHMSQSFNFTFSTGAEIDYCQINGRIYDDKPEGVMIFAYKKNKNTVNPQKIKPDYMTQAGKNGRYNLLGLAPGSYHIFAVRDEFKDFLYNVGEDSYGSPWLEVSLSKKDSIFNNLNFKLTKQDTTLPHIFSAVMTDRYHILIEFSEFVDSSRVNADNFFVFDSTEMKNHKVHFAYKGKAREKQMFLTVKDSLVENNDAYLIVQGISDVIGNTLKYESLNLVVSTRPDTVTPGIIGIVTEFSDKMVDFEKPYLEIFFNDGFDLSLLKNGIRILDKSKNRLPFDVRFYDDASFRIDISGKLKPKSKYFTEIDLKYIVDIAGNKVDSTYKFEFSTINDLDFTGVSGKVNFTIGENPVVVINGTGSTKKTYSIPVSKQGSFDIKRVIPGKYLLWSFADKDSNGVYSYGSIYPYAASEKFSYYPDTLNLRARWPVGDVVVDFKSE